MKMTVIEQMNRIAQRLEALDSASTPEERKMAVADAQLEARMSKQFFNGADIVVRAETLMAQDHSLDECQLRNLVGKA